MAYLDHILIHIHKHMHHGNYIQRSEQHQLWEPEKNKGI